MRDTMAAAKAYEESCNLQRCNAYIHHAAATPVSNSDILSRLSRLEANQNQITELQSRVAKLEEEQSRVLKLGARVASLEATVASLSRDLVNAEDKGVYPGTKFLPRFTPREMGTRTSWKPVSTEERIPTKTMVTATRV